MLNLQKIESCLGTSQAIAVDVRLGELVVGISFSTLPKGSYAVKSGFQFRAEEVVAVVCSVYSKIFEVASSYYF